MLTQENKGTVELQKNSFSESFDIKSFLGRGSFASVCKCTEKTTGKEFAAKIVRFTKGGQADLTRVATEAEIWRAVHHKNIVSLYKTFVQENEICIVMELIQGTTLFDEIVAQTPFSETQSCCIIYQILEALDYLHRKSRIVHRDIKADNILLKQDSVHQNHFHVKITDFGLARRLPRDSDVIKCDVEGAPLYLAPETILADPIGPAVDIWACGVILFLLLVGYPPFWQNDDRKLMSLIVEGRYNMSARYWDQVSDDATDLVKRMLVVHPHKRVTAFKALNHPWITDFEGNEEERIRHYIGNFGSR